MIAEAEAALQAGKSPIISLFGTGEAKTREQIARMIAEGGNLEDLDVSPREIICATRRSSDAIEPTGRL